METWILKLMTFSYRKNSIINNIVSLVLGMHENDPEFHRKMIFTDEAHFLLDEYVKSQEPSFPNPRCDSIWDSEIQRFIVENPQHVIAWCGIWSGGDIGVQFWAYFFENMARVTVMAMDCTINWWLIIFYKQRNHWSFTEKFPNSVISRKGNRIWPPKPGDLLLWGHVKDKR